MWSGEATKSYILESIILSVRCPLIEKSTPLCHVPALQSLFRPRNVNGFSTSLPSSDVKEWKSCTHVPGIHHLCFPPHLAPPAGSRPLQPRPRDLPFSAVAGERQPRTQSVAVFAEKIREKHVHSVETSGRHVLFGLRTFRLKGSVEGQQLRSVFSPGQSIHGLLNQFSALICIDQA